MKIDLKMDFEIISIFIEIKNICNQLRDAKPSENTEQLMRKIEDLIEEKNAALEPFMTDESQKPAIIADLSKRLEDIKSNSFFKKEKRRPDF